MIKGNIFLIICTIFYYFMFKGKMLANPDDFSHWGQVAKIKIENDCMPNFKNAELIWFQSYPLGSASFIYYIYKVIGFSEGHMIWAQILLELSSINTFFAYVKKKRVSSTVSICIYAM